MSYEIENLFENFPNSPVSPGRRPRTIPPGARTGRSGSRSRRFGSKSFRRSEYINIHTHTHDQDIYIRDSTSGTCTPPLIEFRTRTVAPVLRQSVTGRFWFPGSRSRFWPVFAGQTGWLLEPTPVPKGSRSPRSPSPWLDPTKISRKRRTAEKSIPSRKILNGMLCENY